MTNKTSVEQLCYYFVLDSDLVIVLMQASGIDFVSEALYRILGEVSLKTCTKIIHRCAMPIDQPMKILLFLEQK